MTKTMQRWLDKKKRTVERRLAEVQGGRDPRGPGPEFAARTTRYEATGRIQENLIDELKNGVRALHAPLNTLEANWAYMVIASLAWSLKAWFALLTPVAPRWRSRHEADKERVLRMDFRTFVQRLMLVPAPILRTGRQLVYRFLAWRPDMPFFFRLLDAL